MIRKDGLSSQQYRRNSARTFRLLREGVWGGYRSGIYNGPDVTTERGKRRRARTAKRPAPSAP